jgi:hypothetical protein
LLDFLTIAARAQVIERVCAAYADEVRRFTFSF